MIILKKFKKEFYLPAEEAAIFKESFNSFDKNSDGLLNKEEFHAVFKSIKETSSTKKEYTPKQINLFVILLEHLFDCNYLDIVKFNIKYQSLYL